MKQQTPVLNFKYIVLLLVFTVLGSFQTQASHFPENFDQETWENMKSHIIKHGKLIRLERGIALKTMIRRTPDTPNEPHVAEYLSAFGSFFRGQFQDSWYSAIYEDWRLNDEGHWVIDQWQFRVERDGGLSTVRHMELTKTKHGRVLSHIRIPNNGPQDEAILQSVSQIPAFLRVSI